MSDEAGREERCQARIWPSSWSGWGQCPGYIRGGICTAYGSQHRPDHVTPITSPAELGRAIGEEVPRVLADEERAALREALARWLYELYHPPVVPWTDSQAVARRSYRAYADALLDGPLAPLLDRLAAAEAKVAAVVGLVEELDSEQWAGHHAMANRVRAALGLPKALP